MTSDDSDTPRGNGEPSEESETGTPPRDPETGQFLPRDERPTDEGPDANSDGSDGTDHDAPGDSTTEGEADRTVDDASPDDHQTETANAGPSSGEREPEPMPDEPESEPTAGEETTESSDEVEQAETDPPAEEPDDTTANPETGPGEETEGTAREPAPTSPSGRDRAPESTPRTPESSGREPSTASRPPTGPVFVPNPNGYPRPATVFLPAHPWLRLPARPPDHETVSRRG